MIIPLTIDITISHQKHNTHSYCMDVWIIFIIHCFSYVLTFSINIQNTTEYDMSLFSLLYKVLYCYSYVHVG